MRNRPRPLESVAAALLVLVLVTTPAHAFRCGNKIVTKEMHEAQVRRACGAPTTMRNIGRTLRNINIPIESHYGGGLAARHFPGYGFTQEIVITEYVYNFGPRRLMRRLLFEGGVLVSIETLGYGYLE